MSAATRAEWICASCRCQVPVGDALCEHCIVRIDMERALLSAGKKLLIVVGAMLFVIIVAWAMR